MAEDEFKENFERTYNMSFDAKNQKIDQMKKMIQTIKGKQKNIDFRLRECLEYLRQAS